MVGVPKRSTKADWNRQASAAYLKLTSGTGRLMKSGQMLFQSGTFVSPALFKLTLRKSAFLLMRRVALFRGAGDSFQSVRRELVSGMEKRPLRTKLAGWGGAEAMLALSMRRVATEPTALSTVTVP